MQHNAHKADLAGRLYLVLQDRIAEFFAGDQGIDRGSDETVNVDATIVVSAAVAVIGAAMHAYPDFKDRDLLVAFAAQTAREIMLSIEAARRLFAEQPRHNPYCGAQRPNGQRIY